MSAAEALGLPPGVRFDPTGDELVEFYLLPRALGLPPAVPGIIIDDDDTATAATTSAQHPWKLLKRHRRTDDSEAYFFERVARTDDARARGGPRQDRSCGGRWTWVGQKRAPDEALPPRGDGEHVTWGKYSLNLQEGRRKGGSTGWVMHEYTVAASPQCPLLPVKLCHVSFTGHGQKRQRVPDGDDGESEGHQELQHQATTAPPHKRAATGSCMVTTATAMPKQELSEAPAQNQEQQFPNYDCSTSSVMHLWNSDAGISQESSIIVDPSYRPDARSNHQEPFALDQQLTRNQECPHAIQSQAYHQEQFMLMNSTGSETHCGALSATGLGSRQEPPSWHPLTEEQQFSVAQLLGAISSPRCPLTTPAAYHEQQHMQSFAPADLPLSTDQEACTRTEQSHRNMEQHDDFLEGWGGNLNSFCDTTGIQDDDDMAVRTLPAGGCRGGMPWDEHFFYQQPAL